MNFLYLFVFIPKLRGRVPNETYRKIRKLFNFGKYFIQNSLPMRNILVSISDIEFDKFGLQSDDYTFSEFLDIISSELLKQRMKESSILAEKFGLSEIEMDETNMPQEFF